MKQYIDLVDHIMTNGEDKPNRTGIDTRAVFGYQMRFDLQEGFPLLTTKRLHLDSIIHELLWFLSGSTNIEYLTDNGVSIWDEWADKDGDLGPIYGYQWRNWPGDMGGSVDQIKEVVHTIKNDPDSRRMIVCAWNVSQIHLMALPPCHCLFQFYVSHGKLSCQLYQRSCDVGLGVPFNIASYSLLTMMIAYVCDLVPGEFIWTGGDVHIYHNHFEALRKQVKRKLRAKPTMLIRGKGKSIFDFQYDDFHLIDYNPHPRIHMKVAV